MKSIAVSADPTNPEPNEQPHALSASSASNGVWPPPPTGRAAAMVAFPFRAEMRSVEGRVADFRSGNFVVSDQGLLIEGKSVLSFEFQVFVLLFVLFVSLLLGLGWLVVYVILKVARRNEISRIPWSGVHRIVLDEAECRICVVYDAPRPGMLANKHSLTTQMEPVVNEAFLEAITPYVPGKVVEGKIKASLSPVFMFVLVMLLTISVIVVIFVAGFR